MMETYRQRLPSFGGLAGQFVHLFQGHRPLCLVDKSQKFTVLGVIFGPRDSSEHTFASTGWCGMPVLRVHRALDELDLDNCRFLVHEVIVSDSV